ncbi:potassium channel family protein, partial [Planctomycetota bacterium]
MLGLFRIAMVLTALTGVGVYWFRFISDWSWIDSLYMTVITLSTVGYTEVRPLTSADKLFICFYLSAGLGVFLYGVIEIGESIVRSELGQWWRHRNMSQTMKNLKDHFVVCGGGRMGVLLCEDLFARGIQFIVVDSNPSIIESCREKQWNAICADATEDETLAEAGVDRCAGVAATLGSDADNLYVVISARLLSPGVQIVARAHD